jgi:hypothetical protein
MSAGAAPRRVAVLGVSGIGRHHAKWWHLEGAEVCAFLGRSAESLGRATATLTGMFPCRGRGYTSLPELLAEQHPDIVDVCTPSHLHYPHARAALQAGCAVLCEKPFVYDADLTSAQMLGQARELLALAERQQVGFGVCTQYVVSARLCLAICPDRFQRLESYRGYLVSPTRGRAPDPQHTWIDLAPHLLGAIQVVCPDGQPDWTRLELDFAGHHARAQFPLRRPDGSSVHCDIDTAHTDTEPKNVRRLTFNDYTFDIGGCSDAAGVFQARIQTADGVTDREDAMRLLIRSFGAGRAEVPGPLALCNLEWMLRILDAAAARGRTDAER